MLLESKVAKSRDGWKNKAKERGVEVRRCTKALHRHKIKINQLKFLLELNDIEDTTIADGKKKLQSELVVPSPTDMTLNSKKSVILLCLHLFIYAVISFRSIPRIIRQFEHCTPLTLGWQPHFTSVINWMHRLGLGLLNQVKKIEEDWLAIIDHSIGIGTKKALVVLRVRVDALSSKNGAIQLEDCECIGIDVPEKVNGETTAAALEKIFKRSGKPVGIIKDCDATLNKAFRLVAEQSEDEICAIDDIGHVLASGLKADYEKKETFKDFVSIVSNGAKCLYQTNLAGFIPPKIRSKGRFQSISRLGKWVKKMLSFLNGKQCSKEDQRRLEESFDGLIESGPCIESFCDATALTNQVMGILKNEGLDQSTYERCIELSNELPEYSEVKKRLQDWLDKHIVVVKKLTKLPSLISSDIIESLFGQFKNIISRGPSPEMNRSVLFIPTICGNQADTTMLGMLSITSKQDVEKWAQDNIGQTITQKRRHFFKEY
jgi:hypothetical protein